MRCFACDDPVSTKDYDPPTGRFYCRECFEATASIMLTKLSQWDKLANEALSELESLPQLDIFGEEYSLDEIEAMRIVEAMEDDDDDQY